MKKILIIPGCHQDTQNRTQGAINTLYIHEYDTIICSGGVFYRQNNAIHQECVIIQNCLLAYKTAKEKIIIEDESLDTYENIIYSIDKLIQIYGRDTPLDITFASDAMQLQRCKISAPVIAKFWPQVHIVFHYVVVSTRPGITRKLLEHIFEIIHYMDPDGSGVLAKINKKRRKSANNRLKSYIK